MENRSNDQESIHIRNDGGHQLSAETSKSLNFLSDEYDDFNNELSRIGKLFKRLEEQVEEVFETADEIQESSYRFNVKVLGVPEQSSESSAVTSKMCVADLFKAMGADVSIKDIDIAHRMPHRDNRDGPKPIICKFTRRLARNSVMDVRREATNVSVTAVGLSGNADLSQVRVVGHPTPKMQKVYAEAKAFKDRYRYRFCWVKNNVIYLPQTEDSRPLKVKFASDLALFVPYLKRFWSETGR